MRGWTHIVANKQSWDSTLKWLIRVNPAAFVQWLVPGAIYIKEQPSGLQSQEREVDALLEVTMNGVHMLLHIEFQTYNDVTMAERLLLYNVLAKSVHGVPVWSCVIYLLKDGTARQSPLRVTLPDGQTVHEFHFESIEIGQLSPDDILNMDNIALIPLLPLTNNGADQNGLLRMFAELKKRGVQTQVQTTDLELIGYTLASLVLLRKNKRTDLEWLIRRFREMHDILRDTPIYQEILREGLAEGREQGIEQGIERGRLEGRLDAFRHVLLIWTEKRFPTLTPLAQERVARIQDIQMLEDMITEMSVAQTIEDASFILERTDKTFDV